MIEDMDFYEKLGNLEIERKGAKSVYHEKSTWDKQFALYVEYDAPDMVEAAKSSYAYRSFELRYQAQLLYNKTVGTLPKPVGFIVKLLQRFG